MATTPDDRHLDILRVERDRMTRAIERMDEQRKGISRAIELLAQPALSLSEDDRRN